MIICSDLIHPLKIEKPILSLIDQNSLHWMLCFLILYYRIQKFQEHHGENYRGKAVPPQQILTFQRTSYSWCALSIFPSLVFIPPSPPGRTDQGNSLAEWFLLIWMAMKPSKLPNQLSLEDGYKAEQERRSLAPVNIQNHKLHCNCLPGHHRSFQVFQKASCDHGRRVQRYALY